MPAQTSVPLNLDGYTDLPPGKVAAIVTYLEMREPPRLPHVPAPEGLRLERLTDLDRYRALFQRVGEPWLWFSRVVMSDGALAAVLNDPKIEAYALNDGAADIGMIELDFRPGREAELVYLGLVPGVIGQGAGRYMMNEAIRRAFEKPIERFFVHTCSLDHPGALGFYMHAGFTPYKRAIEVADDPRLIGQMPREAAPQIPVL